MNFNFSPAKFNFKYPILITKIKKFNNFMLFKPNSSMGLGFINLQHIKYIYNDLLEKYD